MEFKHIIILCSCPDEAVAARLAECLVEARLAACVNRLSGVRSSYLWQGRRHEDSEVLLLVKTAADRYAEVELRLRALHPYQLPEIIALPIVGGSDRYLAWLDEATAAPAATTPSREPPS